MSSEGSEILSDERNFCKRVVAEIGEKVYDQELGESDLFKEENFPVLSIVKVFL